MTIIDDQLIEQRGWWFAPKTTRFNLHDIAGVTIDSSETDEGTDWLWTFRFGPKGDTETIIETLAGTPSKDESGATPQTPSRSIPFNPDDVWDLHCQTIIRRTLGSWDRSRIHRPHPRSRR